MKECHTGSNTMSRATDRKGKERMTFSLSKPSADFLRDFSAEENAHLSAVVEKMIENLKHTRELMRLSAEVTAYYDSLSDASLREQSAWGEIGEVGLAALTAEEAPREIAHSV